MGVCPVRPPLNDCRKHLGEVRVLGAGVRIPLALALPRRSWVGGTSRSPTGRSPAMSERRGGPGKKMRTCHALGPWASFRREQGVHRAIDGTAQNAGGEWVGGELGRHWQEQCDRRSGARDGANARSFCVQRADRRCAPRAGHCHPGAIASGARGAASLHLQVRRVQSAGALWCRMFSVRATQACLGQCTALCITSPQPIVSISVFF
jgi:hypothetical protein